MQEKEADIREDLVSYLCAYNKGVYNDKHCATVYMLHLECDLCKLRLSDSVCMSSPLFKYVR